MIKDTGDDDNVEVEVDNAPNDNIIDFDDNDNFFMDEAACSDGDADDDINDEDLTDLIDDNEIDVGY